MKNTNVEVEKESNTILSKLSEEQFNKVRNYLGYRLGSFDGFYPTLNTELLTKVEEQFNSQNLWRVKVYEFLTKDELLSVVKDYGSVIHSIEVDGGIRVDTDTLDFAKKYDISAERIEKIGVDEIKKWGDCGDLEEIEENLQSHSIIEFPSSLQNDVLEENSDDLLFNAYTHGCGVSITTKVNISLPNREELFPEKLVA
jgi:hypothetical protein